MKVETIDMLEKIVQKDLSELENFSNLDEPVRPRKEIVIEANSLIDKINESERVNSELLDRKEKQEMSKQDLAFKREQFADKFQRFVDFATKVGVPLFIFLEGVRIHREDKNDIFHFEEFGRITSKVGKEFRLWLPTFKK